MKFSVLALFLSLVSLSFGVPRVGFGPGMQDWGYVTVRPGAHMFYWLYYTTTRVAQYSERPLVIWLQGGPGASGVGYGNFAEIGPLDYYGRPRNSTWVRNYNVLFIDNPVGTGWSYVDSNNLLTRTNTEIARDLVEFMRHFYAQNPEFEKSPLHIFSESYGGKMAAEFGLLLQQEIDNKSINCNLVSVGLGNSWMSPIDSVLSWAPFLLETGYVDIDGYNRVQASALATKAAVDAGQWTLATNLWGATEGVILRETGGIDFYNILTPIRRSAVARQLLKLKDPRYLAEHLGQLTEFAEEDEDEMVAKIMNGPVKEKLGVNRTWTMSSSPVFNAQTGDFMKPVVDIVARLLDETQVKVIVFTGQLDLIVATPGTVAWINNMQWSGLESYKNSRRETIVVDGYIEGYLRKHENFYVYWINRAGHMSPADNPKLLDVVLKDIAGF